MVRTIGMVLLAALFVACGGSARKKSGDEGTAQLTTDDGIFRPTVEVPDTVRQGHRKEYLLAHYWDDLDFADTTALAAQDTLQMLIALRDYVGYYVAENPAPIAALMERASVAEPTLRYFAYMGQLILRDPNSPLRSDELYRPVLEALLASPWLAEWERTMLADELALISRNRPGHVAQDFTYTLASGARGKLHAVPGDYTILFFNNPDCNMCEEILHDLSASPLVAELVRSGRLSVLALYPDEDLTAWRVHAADFPSEWIYAYDATQRISRERLYDLRAIPSLYLLDREKRVILKDACFAQPIEEAIAAAFALPQ